MLFFVFAYIIHLKKTKMKRFFNRTKDLLTAHKKQIINILATLVLIVIISVLTFLILCAFDVVYFEDGMKFNTELFDSFRSSWYGWIIFILLQTVLTMLLCAMPGASMAFILLSQTIYTVAWQAFLLSFISVMTTSSVMYIVGRYGGYKLCAKLLGEDDCKKSLELLREKGTVFFPLMMMFPIFPDDALVMIAGTIKMRLAWFIPSIVIGRGIGIATIIFGLSIVPFDKFTTPWHWIGFIALCAVGICLIFAIAFRFNKYLEKRRSEASAEGSESQEQE